MSGGSLHRLARLTVKEKDRGTVTIARYQERPNFVSGDGKDGPSGSGGAADTPQAPDRPGIAPGRGGDGGFPSPFVAPLPAAA